MATSLLNYEALPGRVVFGRGAVGEVSREAELAGARRVMLIDGLFQPPLVSRIEQDLGTLRAATVSDVVQHVPADLVDRTRARAAELDIDCLVALGGGSATGLAKALALESGAPVIVVPTTYAGSEMTPIWGITSAGRKRTGRDLRVLPRTVIYDPELTVSLPRTATAASGMNALAHCVEAMWTPAANPVTDALAADGIALLASGLRGSVRDPCDIEARVTALRGAWLGGTALAVGGTGLHHKICHVLGGTFDLPHAEVHAILLPLVVGFYRAAAPGALARVARALGVDDAVKGLDELVADLGLDVTLADLGMRWEDLDQAAELAAEVAPLTPAPIGRAEIRELLGRGFSRSEPTASGKRGMEATRHG